MFRKKFYKLLHLIFDSSFLKILFRYHVAASVEHRNLKEYLPDVNCDTIVDIGANRGQFALIARKHFPNAKIMSFEPLKEPAAIFRKVFTGDPGVTLYEMAIGPEEKETKMHVSQADDSSSLLAITELQTNLFPGTSEKETRTVQIKPLNKVLSAKDITSPAFLKVDVQGFEREALEGCRPFLSSFSYIYVECSFVELYAGQSLAPDVIAFLRENSFDLAGVYNLSYDKTGKAIQGDFLFCKRIP